MRYSSSLSVLLASLAAASTLHANLAFAVAVSNEIVYVDKDATGANTGESWDDAKVNLADAINSAGFGDQVWIAEGTYLVTPLAPSTAAPAPEGYEVCASENGTCSFSGTRQVAYGADGMFVHKTGTDGIACTNAVFTDPAPGVSKSCYVQSQLTVDLTMRIYGGFFGSETSVDERDFDLYPVTISGDLGKDDTSDAFGGANSGRMMVIYADNVVVEGVTFRNANLIEGAGGAIAIEGATGVALNNLTFSRNQSVDGGALSIENSSASITNTAFISNRATHQGGAIFIDNTTARDIQFSNVRVTDNSAAHNGGALYAKSTAATVLDISTASFTGNESLDEKGGALYINSLTTTMNITNTTLATNTAEKGGSALRCYSATCNLDYLTLIDNTLVMPNPANEGAVSVGGTSASVTIKRSLISNTAAGTSTTPNVAHQGGALNDGGYNRFGLDSAAGIADMLTLGGTSNALVAADLNHVVNTTLDFYKTTLKYAPVREDSSVKDAIPAGVDCDTSAVDQRDVTRGIGGGCDIGAVEYVDLDNLCFDDKAIVASRSATASGTVFCAGTNGANPGELLKNFFLGSAYPFALLIMLAVPWIRRAK
ncbi:Uncharacterised protein [BD1-7 clade bacterium]|uniref:Right handed beta helix domain-containing protein n=1 Tax=BD1-7 clade bacterium TaxID=2029982 RepID=A0A5S9Q6M9_9GAMM|nr:Uncharacterised protein [BD1-7 clade bacterium]CAA0112751.1 Uncharacterised protein [BD1-7 clade bacterium]